MQSSCCMRRSLNNYLHHWVKAGTTTIFVKKCFLILLNLFKDKFDKEEKEEEISLSLKTRSNEVQSQISKVCCKTKLSVELKSKSI